MSGISNIPSFRAGKTYVPALLAFVLGALAGCQSDATGPARGEEAPTLDPPPSLASVADVVEVRVSASSDDAEERADGSMYITSSDLELVHDGGDQTVGMRFTGVAVPQGASISAAYVQFQVDQKSSETTLLTIEGEAADDAVTFGAADLDISSRTRTGASVLWEPVPWPKTGEAGLDQRTPDITPVVQEIVARPGWSAGNALVLIVTGSGKRTAEAYDGVPSAAPLLHIEYLAAPVASVDVSPAAATIGQGATIQLAATPRDADGNPLPRAVTWSSDDETIAAVSATGLVTGEAPGSATITALSDGVSGSATIDVVWVPVASVEVEPASATIATGGTIGLTATPFDPDGVPLPGRPVAWSSSDETIAVVSNDGLVTGVGGGAVTITATCEGQEGTSTIDVFVPPPGITTPNFKVAFIGDQGRGTDALNVLQLIRDEGADMVIHSGDLDYRDDPVLFDSNVTSVLGADFPYFVSVGNHDDLTWYGPGGYQEKLQQRLDLVPDAYCTGDLGVNSWCTYQGLFFILSGIGTLGIDSEAEAFIRSALEADASDWRICSWHKNQSEMQIGGKGSSVGWVAYETCREQGAIIATAHEHSYSRTKTLTNTELQIVDPDWPDPDNLSVRPGATFAFVSGLGGASIRDQLRCLPTTYPYGCNGEWASIYTLSQAAQFGALFIEFYVDGNPRKARGYFKNVSGEVIDQFTAWSGGSSDPSNAPPVVTAGGDTGGDEGATVSVTATFTDADVADTHTATIDWGDTSVPEWGSVTEAGGAGTVDGSHVYADNGVYTVTVTVDDGRGGIASDSYDLTVTNVAPTADAGGPYAGTEGATLSFGGGATDPGDDTFTFEWDFDYDGTTFDVDASGAGPDHAFASSGTYTVALRVTDDDGGSGQATATVDVVDVDPVAGFTFSPASPSVGASVAFTDASTSYDGITTWEWDFDVAAGSSVDSGLADPTHTYASAGTYTVRLTVREADGDVSWVEEQVTVSAEPINTPPTASYTHATTDLTAEFTDTSADGDGTVVEWSWDFGDGTGTSMVQHPTYTYGSAGTYTVTLTVRDDGGATDVATQPVTVTAAPNNTPVAMDDGYGTNEDVTLTVAAPGVLSNDSDADGDPLTVVLDGDVSNGTLTLSADGGFSYTPDANFNGSDAFTYHAGDGTDDSNVATVTITVSPINDPPVAHAGGPYSGTVGVAVTFDGSGSGDVDGTIVDYAWDFGDGGTGTGPTPSHTYAAEGTYTVTLTVRDDGGATDVATQSVTVAAAPLAVTGIEPGTVDAGSFIDAVITGSGFAPGVSVTVENGSGPAPDVSSPVRDSATNIRVTFTAKAGGPRRDRPWDVRVTNPDGTSVLVVGGLIVASAR